MTSNLFPVRHRPVGVRAFRPRLAALATLVALATLSTAAAAQTYQYRGAISGIRVTEPTASSPAGTPPPLTPPAVVSPKGSLSTSSVSFGDVIVGQSSTASVVLTNDADTALSIGTPAVSGHQAFGAATSCGAKLPSAGSFCLLNVSFAPTEMGLLSGLLTVPTNDAVTPAKTVTLTGTGRQVIGAATANTSADFGPVLVNAPATRTFTFANTGNLAATGTSVALAGTGLTLVSNTCGTTAEPAAVIAGASCSVTVQYLPTALGSLSGASLTFTSPLAWASPLVVPLTGSGVSAIDTSLTAATGVRTFQVMATGQYTLNVSGAQGGDATNGGKAGGWGGNVRCRVDLTAGSTLKVLVGTRGVTTTYFGGGGGGSFVTTGANVPLCIAGGGSGASNGANGSPGGGLTGTGVGGSGTMASQSTGGGGGLLTDGIDSSKLGGGKAFVNGGAGGGTVGSNTYYAFGGWGGGGAGGAGNYNGGPGGGYNGGTVSIGTSGRSGGAGTSYNGGVLLSSASGAQAGNGLVVVSAPAANALQERSALISMVTSGQRWLVTATGATSTVTVTVANSSGVPVSGLALSLTGATSMRIQSTTCGAALAAFASCTVTVEHAPTVSETVSANLAVASSADTPPADLTLIGDTSDRIVYRIVSEGGTLTASTTVTRVFREVLFASYGNVSGTGPNYVQGTCHAANSLSVAQAAFIGKTTGSVLAGNATFGDPCSGTSKVMAVVLRAY